MTIREKKSDRPTEFNVQRLAANLTHLADPGVRTIEVTETRIVWERDGVRHEAPADPALTEASAAELAAYRDDDSLPAAMERARAARKGRK